MTTPRAEGQISHPIERLAVILAAAACLLITIAIWRSVGAYQPMWPLPALYLFEVTTLAIVAALAFVGGDPLGKSIVWAIVGIFAAFCIVGAWSVGFLYLPVTLVLGVVSVTFDLRNKQPIAPHLGACLIAALAQVALMLTVIRLFYPTTLF